MAVDDGEHRLDINACRVMVFENFARDLDTVNFVVAYEVASGRAPADGVEQQVRRYALPADIVQQDRGQHDGFVGLGNFGEQRAGQTIGDERVLVVVAHVEKGLCVFPQGQVARAENAGRCHGAASSIGYLLPIAYFRRHCEFGSSG